MVISLIVIFVMQIFVTIGFSNYTPWSELGESTIPHVLYGTMLFGKLGTVWMTIVSLFAVISTINTALFSISQICFGMAKIKLLPSLFMRKNSKDTPYVGLVIVAMLMIIINAVGLSTSDELTFLILMGCTFWILSYIILHGDVLILRKRMPKVPRTFKLPLGPVIPIVGIIGNAFMIYNIASDWDVKLKIYKIFLIVVAILSVIWIKVIIKRPLFKPYKIKEVMAMESELYHANRNPKLARLLHISQPKDLSVSADFNTGTRPE